MTDIKDVILENQELQAQIEELKTRNEFLERMTNGVKLNNSKLTLERNKLIHDIQTVKNENEELRAKNIALKKDYDDFYVNEYLKRIDECNDLWSELFDIKHMSMWEFAAKYCSDEDNAKAGKQFAQSLLGHTMTDEEVAIDEAENAYVPYSGDDF